MAISQSQARNRLWTLVLCPLMLIIIVGNVVLWHQLSSAHTARIELMGKTISAQLALSLQEPMVRGEHLTINVMLNDLLSGGQDLVAYAAVYNHRNTLIAQAGSMTQGIALYTNRISHQQSVIGRVEIGLGDQHGRSAYQPLILLIATQFVLGILILIATGGLRGVIMFWLYPDLPRHKLATSSETVEIMNPEPDTDQSTYREDGTLVVVRPIPVNLESEIIELFTTAVSLCNGEITLTDSGDLELLFRHDRHEQDAVCCAALMMELVAAIPRPYSAHFALHYCANCDLSDSRFTEARKFTNYLTAIAGGKILISQVLALRIPDALGVEFSSFSHTALPNGQAMVMDGSSRSFRSEIRERLALMIEQ